MKQWPLPYLSIADTSGVKIISRFESMLYHYVDYMIAYIFLNNIVFGQFFEKSKSLSHTHKKLTRFSNFESKLIKLWDIFQHIICTVMFSEIFTRAFKNLKLIELSSIKKSSKLSEIATIFEIYNRIVSLS